MKPKKPEQDLFRIKLVDIINMNHPMVKLANTINWERFDEKFEILFCENNGRPAIRTRLMVGLNYLKYTMNLSDEEVIERWVENPYWQYFCGEEYFCYKLPINASSMSRWRGRLQDKNLLDLLEETIQSGFKMGIINKKSIEKVNVDTTVQEKNITFPTDAKLYYKMIRTWVRFAKSEGIPLKQTYERVGKRALIMVGRYTHARQMKRAKREIRRLKVFLGRLHRHIGRQMTAIKNIIGQIKYEELNKISLRLLAQTKDSKDKIYSIHEPNVECIAKGKVHKKYEFGCKVGIVSSSLNNFILGAMAFHGNPYDGHTLNESLSQSEKLVKNIGEIKQAYVDRGYRGNDYKGRIERIIVGVGIKKKINSLRKWLKRRSCIEADIGHMKNDHRLNRNYLSDKHGDRINVILSAAGFNMHKLIKAYFVHFITWIKIQIFNEKKLYVLQQAVIQ